MPVAIEGANQIGFRDLWILWKDQLTLKLLVQEIAENPQNTLPTP
jgi:hypothetical protein